jgi:hypothetical protein
MRLTSSERDGAGMATSQAMPILVHKGTGRRVLGKSLASLGPVARARVNLVRVARSLSSPSLGLWPAPIARALGSSGSFRPSFLAGHVALTNPPQGNTILDRIRQVQHGQRVREGDAVPVTQSFPVERRRADGI